MPPEKGMREKPRANRGEIIIAITLKNKKKVCVVQHHQHAAILLNHVRQGKKGRGDEGGILEGRGSSAAISGGTHIHTDSHKTQTKKKEKGKTLNRHKYAHAALGTYLCPRQGNNGEKRQLERVTTCGDEDADTYAVTRKKKRTASTERPPKSRCRILILLFACARVLREGAAGIRACALAWLCLHHL